VVSEFGTGILRITEFSIAVGTSQYHRHLPHHVLQREKCRTLGVLIRKDIFVRHIGPHCKIKFTLIVLSSSLSLSDFR